MYVSPVLRIPVVALPKKAIAQNRFHTLEYHFIHFMFQPQLTYLSFIYTPHQKLFYRISHIYSRRPLFPISPRMGAFNRS